jgi:hypothetical protein
MRRTTELIEQAQAALARKERERTIRELHARAEAWWRAEKLRQQEGDRTEADVKRRLAAHHTSLQNRPKLIGEDRARLAWQEAMAKALRDRPDLVKPFVALLIANPDLCEFATRREHAYGNQGWPDLSRKLTDLYTAQPLKPKAPA